MNLGTLTPSNSITSLGGMSNTVIENKVFTDLDSTQAIYLYGATNVTVRNCLFLRCHTSVRFVECTNVSVENCWTTDIKAIGGSSADFVQYDKCEGGHVTGCVVDNGPGSGPEDIISCYKSNNIMIANCQLRGGGPSPSGTGIILGDGDTDKNGNPTTGCVAEDNILVDTGQVGAAIAGGTGHILRRNKIYGSVRPVSNIGIYVWNQGTSGATGHTLTSNQVNWKNSSGSNNPIWTAGGEVTTQTGNVWNDATITAAIFTETLSWSLAGSGGGVIVAGPYETADTYFATAFPGLQSRDAWRAFWSSKGGYPGRAMAEWYRTQGAVGASMDALIGDYFGRVLAGPLFEDAWTGANGAAWAPAKWTSIGNTGTGAATIQTNQGQIVASGGNYVNTRAVAVMTATGNMELTGDIQLPTGGEMYVAVSLRTSGGLQGTGEPSTGYYLEFAPGQTVLNFGKWIAGSKTVLGSTQFHYMTDPQKFRFRVVGSTIRANVWRTAIAEPAGWLFDYTDASIASGGHMLTVTNGGDGIPKNILVDNWQIVSA